MIIVWVHFHRRFILFISYVFFIIEFHVLLNLRVIITFFNNHHLRGLVLHFLKLDIFKSRTIRNWSLMSCKILSSRWMSLISMMLKSLIRYRRFTWKLWWNFLLDIFSKILIFHKHTSHVNILLSICSWNTHSIILHLGIDDRR